MNRVIRRASAVLFLVIALVGGLMFFIYEYFTKAEQWIVSAGSPHIYNSSNIGCGQVYDRNGTILLDITQSRTYAKDEKTVEKAVEMGAELITCNNPDKVLEILRKMGLHK